MVDYRAETSCSASPEPGIRGLLWQADRVDMTYAPRPDGRPDPGEIVWARVPSEVRTNRLIPIDPATIPAPEVSDAQRA